MPYITHAAEKPMKTVPSVFMMSGSSCACKDSIMKVFGEKESEKECDGGERMDKRPAKSASGGDLKMGILIQDPICK